MAFDPVQVIVPNLVGTWLTIEGLRAFQLAAPGLRFESSDPDGPPLAQLAREGGWMVVGQHPPAGTTVEPWSIITVTALRLGGGGGESGDREPREPRPPAGALSVKLEEPNGER